MELNVRRERKSFLSDFLLTLVRWINRAAIVSVVDTFGCRLCCFSSDLNLRIHSFTLRLMNHKNSSLIVLMLQEVLSTLVFVSFMGRNIRIMI